jgi:nitrite reductase (NO-forming)
MPYHSISAWSQQIQFQTTPTIIPMNVYNVDIAPGASLPNNSKFYVPESSSIAVGTKVVWTNSDNFLHTVTFVIGDIFDSDVIVPRQNASYTFFKHGTFEYYCKFHPYMSGQITVY